MKLVDSHVHLQSTEFEDDLDSVLARARDAEVEWFLCAGTDLPTSQAAVALATHPGVVAAVGVHPHEARFYDETVEAELDRFLASGQAHVAGEMGLDYHYDHSPREVQRQVLRQQLRLARRHAAPVSLHNRESDDDMAAILEDEAQGLRVVLHAFDGGPQMMELGCRMGFFFGIGGFLTFKNHPLADRVRDLPRDTLLLETDAPYLSPHPVRGRRNEPAHVRFVAERLAELLEISLDEIASQTTANFLRFLGRPPNTVPS